MKVLKLRETDDDDIVGAKSHEKRNLALARPRPSIDLQSSN